MDKGYHYIKFALLCIYAGFVREFLNLASVCSDYNRNHYGLH